MNALLKVKAPTRTQVRARRQEIEQQIEALINLLDILDGDPDLEDDGAAEPALAWPERGPDVLRHTCDRDRELEEASGFADYAAMTLDLRGEPWLGWTEAIDQSDCGRFGRRGVEADLEEDVV